MLLLWYYSCMKWCTMQLHAVVYILYSSGAHTPDSCMQCCAIQLCAVVYYAAVHSVYHKVACGSVLCSCMQWLLCSLSMLLL